MEGQHRKKSRIGERTQRLEIVSRKAKMGNVKSGPHPHLLTGSGKVREVQFEVQRECPIIDAGRPRIPFAIWVLWPALRVKGRCNGTLFEILRKSDRAIERNLFYRAHAPGSKGVVCEHMGRIIE